MGVIAPKLFVQKAYKVAIELINNTLVYIH
jgi:hypothetical protein